MALEKEDMDYFNLSIYEDEYEGVKELIDRDHLESAISNLDSETIIEELMQEIFNYSKTGIAFVYMHSITGELSRGYIRYGDTIPDYLKDGIVLARVETPYTGSELLIVDPEGVQFQINRIYTKGD